MRRWPLQTSELTKKNGQVSHINRFGCAAAQVPPNFLSGWRILSVLSRIFFYANKRSRRLVFSSSFVLNKLDLVTSREQYTYCIHIEWWVVRNRFEEPALGSEPRELGSWLAGSRLETIAIPTIMWPLGSQKSWLVSVSRTRRTGSLKKSRNSRHYLILLKTDKIDKMCVFVFISGGGRSGSATYLVYKKLAEVHRGGDLSRVSR